METIYEIIIKQLEPYEVKTQAYELENGDRVYSQFSIPDKAKHKKVDVIKGEIDYNTSTIFSQVVTKLNLNEVIKAVNSIK